MRSSSELGGVLFAFGVLFVLRVVFAFGVVFEREVVFERAVAFDREVLFDCDVFDRELLELLLDLPLVRFLSAIEAKILPRAVARQRQPARSGSELKQLNSDRN